MSLRQIYKQEKQKQTVFEDPDELEKELKREQVKKPNFSAFQMSESEEDSEEQQDNDDNQKQKTQQQNQQTNEEGKKKKKKRNKKKKKPVNEEEKSETTQQQTSQQQKKKSNQPNSSQTKKDTDLDFLDKIISRQQEESKYSNSQLGTLDSVLRMERRHFNYKKELKNLFAKSAQQFGMSGIDEEDKEERKTRGHANEEMYEGASKKQKRRLRMVEKLQEKNRVITSKKYLLVQPNPQWPRVEKFLTMEQIRADKKTGQKIFSYIKLPEYQSLDKEFKAVQQTNDISALMEFLRKNFYHHESLVYFADFLRIQGKFSDSFHFLERCLFAFESAWTFEYQPVPPEKSQDSYFVPQARLDMNNEHLNSVFAECLVKYIDILGRKGCSRTAVEYCKLLFCLNPYQDSFGSLMRIDFYAIRAHEYQYLLDFIKKLPQELYPEEQTASFLIQPNFLMTCALAKFYQMTNGSTDYSTKNLEKTLAQLLSLDTHVNHLLDLEPEALIMTATLLYPDMVLQLLKKVAQKQINQNFKKSHFIGYQAKTWTDILAHPLFTDIGKDYAGNHNYTWVLSTEERIKLSEDSQEQLIEETLNKVYQIFVSRSFSLFAPDHILLWLKETIGFVLNSLDSCLFDRDLLIAKLTSLVISPFGLSRYVALKQSDFTDDVTTINPNELMMGGNQQEQNEGGMANQQLQQMINQLNVPQHHGMMQQQLIQEREHEDMSEQEMIAMQEAILAQMGEHENLYFDEDEGDSQGGQPGANFMGYINNMFGFGGNNNQPQPPNNQ